jgi:DNA-binding transcriptional MerR regulator/methylmalonyl-CoA mutase cobalamin-binding subunit
VKGKYTVNEVEERTSVPATTLRQWERRYGFPQPERSESGYRLYNDIDLQRINLMKGYIDDGVPASRAASLVKEKEVEIQAPKSNLSLQKELVRVLTNLDENKALEVLNEAYALYSIDAVIFEVLAPTIVDIGDLWHQGKISITTEHFASSFITGRLHALLSFSPTIRNAPTVIVACAPQEQHELAALMLAVCLRRAGYGVYFVGANTPIIDLIEMAKKTLPVAIMISASTPKSYQALEESGEILKSAPTHLIFGGRVFADNPELAKTLSGTYLGEHIPSVVEHFDRLIQGGKAL